MKKKQKNSRTHQRFFFFQKKNFKKKTTFVFSILYKMKTFDQFDKEEKKEKVVSRVGSSMGSVSRWFIWTLVFFFFQTLSLC